VGRIYIEKRELNELGSKAGADAAGPTPAFTAFDWRRRLAKVIAAD
jgi:hypothetical protein